MNTRPTRNAIAFVLLLLAAQDWGSMTSAQEQAETTASDRFQIAVSRYVSLHRTIERFVPPIKDVTDPLEAKRSMVAMSEAIRKARWSVTEGNVFMGQVAIGIQNTLTTATRNADPDCQRGLSDILHSPADTWSETVNDAFPWALSRMLPSCVRDALPELPIELQYRVVGADLVLVDLHANLIVDILRGAFPQATR